MSAVMDDYFGLCPECHRTDGCINVGKNHWFLCDAHRTKWCAGWNLFSNDEETEADWIINAAKLNGYSDVEPFYYPRSAAPDEHGLCPICHGKGEMVPVGRKRWMVCHEHQVIWWAGCGLCDMACDDCTQSTLNLMQRYQAVEPYHFGDPENDEDPFDGPNDFDEGVPF